MQFHSENDILTSTGFSYSIKDDVFYSTNDAWQRNFGYCHLYDEAMPSAGMIVDCEPISFDFNNRHWLILLRKGQYGMATGGEAGIYNTTNPAIRAPGFHGIFYESISDLDSFPITITLKKNRKKILRRSSTTGWFAGLKFTDFSTTSSLQLDAKFVFPNKKMRNAFLSGLKDAGYSSKEYTSYFTTAIVHFTTPHTLQPASRTRVQEAIVQQANENNCKLYHQQKQHSTNTLENFRLLSNSSSELCHKFLKSFHSKELYASYELLSPILKKTILANQTDKIDDPLSDSYDL